MPERPRILVITPVAHIKGVPEVLRTIGDVTVAEDPSTGEVARLSVDCDAIFTNPNKSNVYLGAETLGSAARLKVICTASTGTTHVDVDWARRRGIVVLSLKEERDVIDRISSTAEHAFALTLSALRRIPWSAQSVLDGGWDYTKFIGRQMDRLTVGVIGYGRLGRLYTRYAQAFGSRVLVHDPYVGHIDARLVPTSLSALIQESDIISLHVHVTAETRNMVSVNWFESMRKSVVLVNTSRGEIVDEAAVIQFLRATPTATYATDVLADETTAKASNPLIEYAMSATNILITPHIGGMTVEAQEIAYGHAAVRLKRFFTESVEQQL